MKGKVKKFTLLELLIAISVIAILAGLLLPALNKARERAYQVKCMGTMKTMIFAALQYADDSGGRMLPRQTTSDFMDRPGPGMNIFWNSRESNSARTIRCIGISRSCVRRWI